MTTLPYVEPRRLAALGRLRTIGSTGSPLAPQSYRWVYDQVRRDVWLTPVSGGTDFAGAFVGGVPTLPVYVGEMQARCLGADVQAWDDVGRELVDEVGELVCVTPIPSMPLYLWNDPGGKRLHETYFDVYPGVWRHGDWLCITQRGGAVIYGRSDATIIRYGVRMGTSELYRVVEAMPEVMACRARLCARIRRWLGRAAQAVGEARHQRRLARVLCHSGHFCRLR